jgi:cyclohexanecarboxyl-CoA dehydrogenase
MTNPYIVDDLATRAEHSRHFATGRVVPLLLERDKTRALDSTLIRGMGKPGLFAPELPEQCGGQCLGCLAAGVIQEEISSADLSIFCINRLASLDEILTHRAKLDFVKPWLTQLTQGRALLAIALAEPGGGSDAINLGWKMERVRDHYVINDEKTSNLDADEANTAMVFIYTGWEESSVRDVSSCAGADGSGRHRPQPTRMPRTARHWPRHAVP